MPISTGAASSTGRAGRRCRGRRAGLELLLEERGAEALGRVSSRLEVLLEELAVEHVDRRPWPARRETPSFRRAITVSQRTRQSPRPRVQVGMTCACIMIGTNTSTASPTSTPWNPGGATPTTVIGWPFTLHRPADHARVGAETARPEAVARARPRGCAPGVRSSSGVKSRPAAGRGRASRRTCRRRGRRRRSPSGCRR